MPSMSSPLFTVGLVLFTAVLAFYFHRPHASGLPGPTPLPILGNLLPLRKVHIHFAQLRDKYGPIYALRVFRTPIVVLNSAQTGREMLEGQRAAVFWNRPLLKVIEMAGMDRGVVFEVNAGRLLAARNLLKLVLQPRELAEYTSNIQAHIVTFLHNLSAGPDDYIQHIRTLTAGVMLRMSHGYETLGRVDPYVAEANITVQNFARASQPPGHIVDWLPILANLPAWLPGMQFKCNALAWREQYTQLAEKGHSMVEQALAQGKARSSLTGKALSQGGENIDKNIVMFTATQLYTGGADTTVSTLSSFFLAMIRFPEVQRKAQMEIDKVLGGQRLPEYGDRARLPYTESLMKEILRCYPPIPAVFRLNPLDESFNGYTFEKHTTVIVNFWAMLHDENVYPDCHAFDPERWNGATHNRGVDPLEVVFGFGRRACPGRHLAEEMIFVSMACVLAVFDLHKPLDRDGKVSEPSGEYSDGGITFPLPFECSIRLRSKDAERLLEASVSAL